MKKFVVGLCVLAFFIVWAGPAFSETITGVVDRLQVTLKLKDGTNKVLEVRDDVNLDAVDEGDEVQVVVENNEIQSIKVTKEDKDPPRPSKKQQKK